LSGAQSQKIGKPNNASIVYQSTMHLNYLHLKKNVYSSVKITCMTAIVH